MIDIQVEMTEWLVARALDEARRVKLMVAGADRKTENLPTLPPHWVVVLVLLEEAMTVLLEKPTGREGDPGDFPF